MLKIVKALAFMAFKCFIEKLQKYPIPMRAPLHYTNQHVNKKILEPQTTFKTFENS